MISQLKLNSLLECPGFTCPTTFHIHYFEQVQKPRSAWVTLVRLLKRFPIKLEISHFILVFLVSVRWHSQDAGEGRAKVSWKTHERRKLPNWVSPTPEASRFDSWSWRYESRLWQWRRFYGVASWREAKCRKAGNSNQRKLKSTFMNPCFEKCRKLRFVLD